VTDIATQLGLSGRTLRRQLAARRGAFRTLVNECRKSYALHQLQGRRNLALSELALELNYSDYTAFSRAFRRWSGISPRQYRQLVGRAQSGVTEH